MKETISKVKQDTLGAVSIICHEYLGTVFVHSRITWQHKVCAFENLLARCLCRARPATLEMVNWECAAVAVRQIWQPHSDAATWNYRR